MDTKDILKYIEQVSLHIECSNIIEILLIGGAAGMLTGQLDSSRTTMDCDVYKIKPDSSEQILMKAARIVADNNSLPAAWLNTQAMQLNILPDGWHTRSIHVATFKNLRVLALSRKDLLATKFYACHTRDIEDIQAMKPTSEECDFISTYLQVMKLPSRQANLDSISRAEKLITIFRSQSNE